MNGLHVPFTSVCSCRYGIPEHILRSISPDERRRRVEEAALLANAKAFIHQLPNNYMSEVNQAHTLPLSVADGALL